ncbi:MAG: DNA-3-methyladenine glycosylase 2 family protein [Candidatus Thorarchaeota archaeon]|nr:MAG: DNA-3-methyladenine glycosylase 2 family protein [Candidatus Thorarchaeota archaeon]
MSNIFTVKVLNMFKKQVPELKDAVDVIKLTLQPTLMPPFEMLIRSIVYQQLSGKAAKTIHDRLLELVGKLTPDRILAKSQEELKSVGLSRQKAAYLHYVAEAFRKGGFLWKYRTIESLAELTSQEIVNLFVEIKGVGEWTVEMYLIFAMGRLDILSEKDLGVRKGVMKLYNLDKVPTPKEVIVLAEKWHPLETVGTFLAWRVLEEDFIFP